MSIRMLVYFFACSSLCTVCTCTPRTDEYVIMRSPKGDVVAVSCSLDLVAPRARPFILRSHSASTYSSSSIPLDSLSSLSAFLDFPRLIIFASCLFLGLSDCFPAFQEHTRILTGASISRYVPICPCQLTTSALNIPRSYRRCCPVFVSTS